MFPSEEGEDEDEGEFPIPSVDIPGEDETGPRVDVPDPTENTPSVDAPSTEVPTTEVPDDTAAPTGLKRAFWTLVAVVDMAVLALGVGALLVVFRDNLALGGSLLVAGAGLLFYARERYRTVSAADWADEEASSDGTTQSDADRDGASPDDASSRRDEPPAEPKDA